eukprot:1769940-Amphidinium_carterae.2
MGRVRCRRNGVTQPKQAPEDGDKRKICSAYATKEGCPKGALCLMAAKGGHPRMRDKCLRCSAEGHLYKSFSKPNKSQDARQNEADWDGEAAAAEEEATKEANEEADWYECDAAAKGKGKGKGKAKGKSKDRKVEGEVQESQVYFTSMLEFDEDAHASTWMNTDSAEHAPEETIAEQDMVMDTFTVHPFYPHSY